MLPVTRDVAIEQVLWSEKLPVAAVVAFGFLLMLALSLDLDPIEDDKYECIIQ